MEGIASSIEAEATPSDFNFDHYSDNDTDHEF